jgi:glycosyltransferase involved in cell wall biosynthesis
MHRASLTLFTERDRAFADLKTRRRETRQDPASGAIRQRHEGDCPTGFSSGSTTASTSAGLLRGPVIASRNGSVPEVIDDGTTGFIVDDEEAAGRSGSCAVWIAIKSDTHSSVSPRSGWPKITSEPISG